MNNRLILVLLVAVGWFAGSEALAAQIVRAVETDRGKSSLIADMYDAAARPLFARLGRGAEWGPEHPKWNTLLPAFATALGDASERHIPGGFGGTLKTMMLATMSEQDLAEVSFNLSDAGYVEFQALIARMGFDEAFVFRLLGMATNPSLYSQAEKDALKLRVQSLKDRESEFLTLKPSLDAAQKKLNSPAMTKYKTAVSLVLAMMQRRMETDAEVRVKMQAFVEEWRIKVQIE